MRFDLTDLRLFLLVVDAGSITHGAAKAGLSLPSASERLRGMEEKSGLQLLTRSRRGVAPTTAGEALAHHARIILRQMDHLQGELGGFAKGLKGTVRVLANTAAITEFLPAALAPYLASHPNVDIDLQERLSTEIVKAVSGGLADIGILSEAVDTGMLELHPFAIDRLVVVVPPDHPLADEEVAFADIVRHEFVGLSIGSALQDHIDEHAVRAGHPLKFRARLRTFDGICQMAAQNVGIGIVPESAARRFQKLFGIRTVRLSDEWAMRQLSVCVRKPDELSPFARELVLHLRGA
jgi:DNA-binding transcriptional LysR family regulator